MDGGKGLNNEEFVKNVDLDKVYDTYDNGDENITEYSIVWVNTNKIFWEERVIKIPFSDMSEDAKHLKLIWINRKKEERVLIKIPPKEYKHKSIPLSTHCQRRPERRDRL